MGIKGLIEERALVLVPLLSGDDFSVEKTENVLVVKLKTYPINDHFGEILNI